MPGYIKKVLKQIQDKLRKHQQQPFPAVPIKHGAKKQYIMQESKAPLMDVKGKKFIQEVCQKFLILSRVVDSTLLCPISAIAS